MTEKGWRVFIGSFILLLASFSIYFVRYPMWSWKNVEPIFAVLTLSYLAVMIIALCLIKLDLKTPLSSFFSFHGWRIIFIGLALAFLFQAFWYGLTIGLGSKLEFLTFPTLNGYESYSYFWLPLAFALYAVFAVFGAFAEEVTYRGYVQSRISSSYGIIMGISVATIFFSLQHIHIFQLSWISNFIQGQLIEVLLFGIFAGCFFFKSKGDIWSVFAFHGLSNLFSISLPIQITYSSPFTYYISTTVSYVFLLIILRLIPLCKEKR
jgi:membrane protease YdiL (CAAX protease family)